VLKFRLVPIIWLPKFASLGQDIGQEADPEKTD